MSGRERPFDRGSRLGRAALVRLGQDLRDARLDRSLTVDRVAAACGISNAEVSRIERALSPRAPFLTLARIAAIVGLDLSARLYPGAGPVRDEAHLGLLADLRAVMHPSIRWRVEAPMAIAGDARAWDVAISGRGWMYGIEAETAPRDVQALVRRIQLKVRDSEVDGALLAIRDSRAWRDLRRAGSDVLAEAFPVDGRRAMQLLARGVDPGGAALLVVPRVKPQLGPTSASSKPIRRA